MGARVGRQAPVIAVTAEQRAAVEELLRQRALRPRLRERLEMVKAAALGQDLAAIAAWSGRSAETVRHWLGRFVAGGVAALGDAPRSGRPPAAGAAYLAQLEALVETPPRACGLPYDVWTSPRLSAYLAQRTGVRIAPSWLRTLLARRRFASGRPKHTLGHLQDPAEVAACERELAAAGEKGGGGARALRVPPPG
jgi:transposase